MTPAEALAAVARMDAAKAAWAAAQPEEYDATFIALTDAETAAHEAAIALVRSLPGSELAVAWMHKHGIIMTPAEYAATVKNQSDKYRADWTPLFAAPPPAAVADPEILAVLNICDEIIDSATLPGRVDKRGILARLDRLISALSPPAAKDKEEGK